MKKLKSLSEKRLIIEAMMNGKKAKFLLDTGASVGIVNSSDSKSLNLAIGKPFPVNLVGAGGEFSARHCSTFAYIDGKPITQFVVADINNVVGTIKRDTGITINGIISLPQMKQVGIQIDANDNLIIIE